ncbi:MAG: ABC transporter permease [Candidatus Krumholzibacteria bacterium]|jgi:ABC-2 type transport system permease protein|nr:ABC transporter permease [Candidatus Krumholzibacteria bacterium]
MSKVLTVIRKEYLERVRSKAFLVGTLLGPLFMALLVIGPTALGNLTRSQERTVAVLDLSGEVFEPLAEVLRKNEDNHVKLRRHETGPQAAAGVEELKARVLAKDVDAGLVIGADFFAQPQLTFYNTAVSAVVLRDETLRPALNEVLREERFQRAGVPADQREYILARSEWTTLQLSAAAEAAQSADVGIIAAVTMVMIIYIMVLLYGQQNLTVVIEEKSSRMVEVLLSSLRPEQLLVGKVVGIGLAALTQVAIWTLAGFLVSVQGIAVAGAEINLTVFSPWLWLNFLVFFVMGYFLYASLYAGIGAMCNSVQDAQQFSMVLTMGMVIPILLMMVVIRAPDQPMAMILSLVPFFSPILMFMRVTVSDPPIWQVVLSWLLLALTIWWANKAAGKLFRAGILLYGSSPTWKSLGRALSR